MPQLDKVHFFSQYFWLCVFYFGFYFLVSKHFLPAMARALQLRKNKCSHTSQQTEDKELRNVQESGSTTLDNMFSLSHKFWSENGQRTENWYKGKVSECNHNYLQECNALYVRKLGDYSFSQNAALLPLETGLKDSLNYSNLLLRQCTNKSGFSGSTAEKPSAQNTFHVLAKKISKKKSPAMDGSRDLPQGASQSLQHNKKSRKPKKTS